jgi:hypothetical protein
MSPADDLDPKWLLLKHKFIGFNALLAKLHCITTHIAAVACRPDATSTLQPTVD